MTTTTTHRDEGRVLPTTVDIRSAGTDGGYSYLEGRAVPYGIPADIGYFTEQFAAGAFSKSIKEAARSLPLLAFHMDNSMDAVIGVAEDWRDAEDGLYGTWRLDKGDAAQRVARMVADGMLGYMSVRFQPTRSVWSYVDEFAPDKGAEFKDSVVRTEARLLEVSVVSTPAYKDATISKIRSGERALDPVASGHVVRGWQDWLRSQERRDTSGT